MGRSSAVLAKKKMPKPSKKPVVVPDPLFRRRSLELTDRERAVLKFFARGHTYQEIGEKLEISPKTVGSYLQRVREKARAKNRSDLITLALKEGLVNEK